MPLTCCAFLQAGLTGLISPVSVSPSCQHRKVRLPGFMGVPWAFASPPAETTRPSAGIVTTRASRMRRRARPRAGSGNRRGGRGVGTGDGVVRIMTDLTVPSFRGRGVSVGFRVRLVPACGGRPCAVDVRASVCGCARWERTLGGFRSTGCGSAPIPRGSEASADLYTCKRLAQGVVPGWVRPSRRLGTRSPSAHGRGGDVRGSGRGRSGVR